MAQTPKTYQYLDPLSWQEMETALSKLLPNYSQGQINGVMCEYGFTSDWRKVLSKFRIESYRGEARYKDMLMEEREFRGATVVEALQEHNPNGRFEKISFPRLSKEEQAAGVMLYDWYAAPIAKSEDPSALLCNAETPGLYLKVWPL